MHADSNNSRDFNRWLDAALQVRLDEPRAGLEQRVLARLRAEPLQKTFVWWPALAVVAAALLISVALVLVHAPQKGTQTAQKQLPAAITTHSYLRPSDVASVARAQRWRLAKRPATTTNRYRRADREQPKLATFPSTSPASDQERMLATLAIRKDSYEVAAESPRMAPLKDLQIRELDVPLLEGTPPDTTPK
jgi:hypothetical protein